MRTRITEADRPIRILRIIARLNIGGPAIQALTLSSHLMGPDFKTLLACGRISPGEGDMAYLAPALKVEPRIIQDLGRELSPRSDRQAYLALNRIIQDFAPHLIHTHTAKAGFLGRLAALRVNRVRSRRQRIRMVHTFHGHVFDGYFHPLKTALFIWIERYLARRSDRIVVISKRQKYDICHKYRIAAAKKVCTIRLGFNLDRFNWSDGGEGLRQRIFPEFSEGQFLVGIVGRLTPIKNHALLLKAIALLKAQEQIGAMRFAIIGDGELRSELTRQAVELGIRPLISFAGWHRDMVPVLRELDALVLTSKNEGTPVSLIEAMAARRPIVATKVGGVPDLMGRATAEKEGGVEHCEHGLLVPSNDPGALANSLLLLARQSSRQRATIEMAHRFAHRVYSRERLVQEIQSLYLNLIGRRS